VSTHPLIDLKQTARTPVAVFAYNRPRHTARALEALARCRRLDECSFHFYLDGPKTPESSSAVAETLHVLESWQPTFNAYLTVRSANLGLATSIVGGVSDLVAHYGRVIVLEDDLIVEPDFLHYMIECLDHYADEPAVMQVAALALQPPSGCPTDVFLLPVTSTWGWATWARAWTHFSWTPIDLEKQQSDPDWKNRFNINGSFAGNAMLADRLAGKNSSWGILWWYAVSRLSGLVAYPRQSLVRNTGFDGSGTHCGTSNLYDQIISPHQLARLPSSLTFPDEALHQEAHLTALEKYFKSLATPPVEPKPRRSLLGSFSQSLRHVLRK
jgi:hypothetical protein